LNAMKMANASSTPGSVSMMSFCAITAAALGRTDARFFGQKSLRRCALCTRARRRPRPPPPAPLLSSRDARRSLRLRATCVHVCGACGLWRDLHDAGATAVRCAGWPLRCRAAAPSVARGDAHHRARVGR
jgi:hypothetical protein